MTIFDKLNSHFEKKIPFVVYCKPTSTKIIGIFQRNDTLNIASKNVDKGFVMNNFGDNHLWLIPENQSEVVVEDFDFEENYKNEKKNEISVDDENYSKEKYTSLVQKGIDAIKKNEFEKLVLAREQKIYFNNINRFQTFKNILLKFPDSFRYIFYHPKLSFWYGAFSEKLLKVDGSNFETMALAGTQKCENISDVEWQQKEINEQQFVTDYIKSALKNEVTKMVVSEAVTIQHGELCHIKTDISGQLNEGSDVFSLLDILNPTPAVCGIPKDAAKQFILKNEQFSREFYSGVVGELNKDFETNEDSKSQLFVNLRCMKVEKDFVVLYVGAGITKDSAPEKEWEETKNKTLAMKNCLAF